MKGTGLRRHAWSSTRDDQEVLRWLEAEEQKLYAQKLQKEAEKREADEMDVSLQRLADQKGWLLENMKRRKEIADVEWAKWVEAGEEESIVEINVFCGRVVCLS